MDLQCWTSERHHPLLRTGPARPTQQSRAIKLRKPSGRNDRRTSCASASCKTWSTRGFKAAPAPRALARIAPPARQCARRPHGAPGESAAPVPGGVCARPCSRSNAARSAPRQHAHRSHAAHQPAQQAAQPCARLARRGVCSSHAFLPGRLVAFGKHCALLRTLNSPTPGLRRCPANHRQHLDNAACVSRIVARQGTCVSCGCNSCRRPAEWLAA